MIQLSIICGTSSVNNQIFFLDGYDSHFNDRALTQMKRNKFSPSYLKQLNPSTISPMTTGLNQKWSLSATFQRISGCWSMVPRGFNLTTWTLSWFKYRKPSYYQLETSSGTASLKLVYSPSYHQHDNKYTGVCSLNPIIFKRHQLDYKMHTCTY